MIKVHLNSGALCKFKKGKVTFGKEHVYITYDNITYQKELKNVHKVVEKIKGIEGIGILLYRGYTSRRGIAVAVVEEITVNKKGKIIDESICG